MAKGMSITRNSKGLSKSEVNEVLSSLKRAKAKGLLPSLSYEYNPHTLLFGKDPLYVKPKAAPLARTAVKVRQVLRSEHGSKYSVRLV